MGCFGFGVFFPHPEALWKKEIAAMSKERVMLLSLLNCVQGKTVIKILSEE